MCVLSCCVHVGTVRYGDIHADSCFDGGICVLGFSHHGLDNLTKKKQFPVDVMLVSRVELTN